MTRIEVRVGRDQGLVGHRLLPVQPTSVATSTPASASMSTSAPDSLPNR